MRFTIATLALLALVPLCAGHSQLNNPAAWNPRPSKRSPCGGGAATAATPLVAGQPWTFDWQIIAGDGRGPVTVKVDSAAGSTFNAAGVFTSENFVGKGNYQFTIPGATTATMNGPVTLQLKSSSNWYACASINAQGNAVTDAPTNAGTIAPTQPPPPPCQIAAGLQMCGALNGKNVAVAPGRNLAQIEAGLLIDRDAMLGNPDVFDNSKNAGCIDAVTRTMCAMTFPTCGTDQRTLVGAACKTTCENLNSMCVTDPQHADLFKCTEGTFSATTSDVTGACPVLGAVANAYAYKAPALLTPLAATGGPSDQPTTRPKVTTAPIGANGGISAAGSVSVQPLVVAVLALTTVFLF